MKKATFIIGIISIFSCSNLFGQYCTPPNFNSGPFTGILSVDFESISNTSSGSDGYTDYTSGNVATIMQGSSYAIDIRLEHTIINSGFTDNLDLRVWIDWNQDGDFADAGEEVVTQVVDLSGSGTTNAVVYSGSITVPTGATLGNTRMRVYEDMMVADGHLAPTPCGYSSGVGQHGECEDYALTIVSASTAGIEDLGIISKMTVFPNPTSDNSTIQFNLNNSENVNIHIFNLIGEVIYETNKNFNAGLNSILLETEDFLPGVYIINVSTAQEQMSKQLTVF